VIWRSPSASYLYDLKLVPGRPQVMTFWAWAQGFPLGPDPAFKTYDYAGNEVRQFGMRNEFKMAPREFAVMRTGYVIGTAANLGDVKRGRLMLWNADDGKLLQDTSTDFASMIEISSDGRLVAVHIGPDVNIYSIN
jgi:hypothetical protein